MKASSRQWLDWTSPCNPVPAEGCVEALQAASSPIIKLRSRRQERMILRLRVGVSLRLRLRLRSE